MSEIDFHSSWNLPPREARVLRLLLNAGPKGLSKDDIMTGLYGEDADTAPDIKVIDVFVCKLRSKLAFHGIGEVIETLWGYGYAIPDEAKARLAEAANAWNGRATTPPEYFSKEVRA